MTMKLLYLAGLGAAFCGGYITSNVQQKFLIVDLESSKSSFIRSGTRALSVSVKGSSALPVVVATAAPRADTSKPVIETPKTLPPVTTVSPTVSPTAITMYTGKVSTWQIVSNLTEYFTPAEEAGLKNKQCGDLQDPSNPWRWQGTSGGSRLINSGPCCTDGHVYGWFGKPMEDTTALRKVEVTSDGKRVPPFQMKELVSTMKEVYLNDENSLSDTYTIWLMGDSTMIQLFHAMLCGLVRIGGQVELCETGGGHYSHPLCNMTKKINATSLDQATTNDVDKQTFVAQLPYHAPTDARKNGTNVGSQTRSTSRGTRIRVLNFPQGNLCSQNGRVTEACTAYESRLRNLFEQEKHQPDFMLVNFGLHARNPPDLKNKMEMMLKGPLLKPYHDRVVWRETSITHFPDAQHTGVYEQLNSDKQNHKIPPEVGTKSCAALNDDVENTRMTHWRQRVSQEWLSKDFYNATSIQIPILSMNETEWNMFETYSIPLPEKPNGDCVHHVYSPLYYDSFFWRLSRLLKAWKGSPVSPELLATI